MDRTTRGTVRSGAVGAVSDLEVGDHEKNDQSGRTAPHDRTPGSGQAAVTQQKARQCDGKAAQPRGHHPDAESTRPGPMSPGPGQPRTREVGEGRVEHTLPDVPRE